MSTAPAPVRHPFPLPPGPGEATEVADGILWMRLPLPMALDHVNVYALAEADGWTLVDTGFDSPASREAWAALRAGPLRGRPVRRVIVTHHHPDHVGLAGWFQGEGAELLAPRTAWLYARMLLLDVQARPSPEAMAFYRAAGMEPERLAKRAEERPFNFADVVAPMPPTFRRVSEGEVLAIGGRRWRVRFGQGHAPDHATLWEEGGDLVIAGDQALPGITSHLGIYVTEADANPVGEWIDACRRLAAFARPDQLVLPGHRLPFAGLPDRLEALAAHHEAALDRLAAALAEPLTGPGAFPAVFGRAIREGEYGLALSEALAHLAALVADGRAVRETGADGVWRWRRA
jgi:glyoxylase-like metal-dependent hydrolase (beta-lactamase superfamily II)